jgi:FkbM family methyltransferase
MWIGRLDDFSKELELDKIDLLEIDTEGSELSILKGAERDARRYCKR